MAGSTGCTTRPAPVKQHRSERRCALRLIDRIGWMLDATKIRQLTGGENNTAGDGSVVLTADGPSADHTQWEVAVNNTSASEATISVSAICIDAPR
jgi:hypothetical protein